MRIKSIGYIAIGLFLVNSACGVNKKSSDKSTVVPIPQEIDGVLNTIDTTTNLIKGKLSNGLTYYVQSNPYPAGETIYRLFLKTGSVAETEAQKGLAHFVEHLAFNGTINFPGDSLVRFLEQRGAKFGKDLNAHTSYNETVYKLQLPSKDTVLVDHTLQILADWLGGLRLDSAAIEKERGIIYAEWLSRRSAGEEVQQAFLQTILNGSKYADRPVIGDTSVILGAPAEEIRAYYKYWYNPALAAVAVVGDIDSQWVLNKLHEKFGKIPTNGIQPVQWPIDDYEAKNIRTLVSKGEKHAELNIFNLLDNPAPVIDEETYLASLQRQFVRDLLKKRFSEYISDGASYATGSVQRSDFINTKNIVLASVRVNPEKPQTSLEDFAKHLAQVRQYGFATSEIANVIKSYEGRLKRRVASTRPSNSSVIMEDIYQDFYNGQPRTTPQQLSVWYEATKSKIDSVSLLQELQRWFSGNSLQYLLSAYPELAPQLPSDEEVLAIFENAQSTPQTRYYKAIQEVAELSDFTPTSSANEITSQSYIDAIDADHFELSNGATVIFRKPMSESDRVTITGFRKGGLYSLDSTDYVTGTFAGQVVALSGAGEHSRESLNEYLAGKTPSIRFLIDKTRTGIAGSSSIDEMKTLFELIHLRWTAPRLDSLVFNQLKKRAIEQARQVKKTSATHFARTLDSMVNGVDYTTRELNAERIDSEFNADKIIPVFNHSFGTATAFTFIITGELGEDEMELALDYLASLPTGEAPTTYTYNRSASIKGGFVERFDGDAPSASVTITYQRNQIPSSYFETQLLNDLSVAVLRSALLRELREEMSKVYSVGVSGSFALHPDTLARTTIQFNCDTDDVDLLIKTVNARLTEMANNPASIEKLLADVKNNMRKEHTLDIQKDAFWGSYIRNSIFNGEESFYFVQHFDQMLDAIRANDLARFIKTQLLDQQPVIGILHPKTANKTN